MAMPDATTTPTVQLPALLVGREQAAAMLGVSSATFDRWRRSGRLGPRSVDLGGRELYRVRELGDWCDAACPGRVAWDEQQTQNPERDKAKPRIAGSLRDAG